MDKKSKIYVTGHTGMLGSAMVKMLLSRGYTNIVTCTHEELDLTRQKDVEDFFANERPEYVFHIAAKTGGVLLNKAFPTEYLAEGINIALNVLNAAHLHDAKGVVYTSSVNVYPENAPQPIKEECFLSGRMPFFWEGYALAKAVGIKYCQSASRQFGQHYVSAVLPAVYGFNNFGTTVMPMLMDKFADAVLNGKPTVEIWGTGHARREFIHAEDVADALLFLMEHGQGGQHYNTGTGEEHTIRELAEILREVSGFQGELIFDTTKPESAGRQFLDNTKLYRLGWRPKKSFREGVAEVYREHFQRQFMRMREMGENEPDRS